MLFATASSPWRTPYLRAMPPSVSPGFTTCFVASVVGPAGAVSAAVATVGVLVIAVGRGAEAGAEAALAGMMSFWPTQRTALVFRWLAGGELRLGQLVSSWR